MPPLVAPLQHPVRKIQPGTVVAREENQRVVFNPLLFQRLSNTARAPVDGFDHVTVQPSLALAFELVGYVQVNVRHGMGQINEEGPCLGSIQE